MFSAELPPRGLPPRAFQGGLFLRAGQKKQARRGLMNLK